MFRKIHVFRIKPNADLVAGIIGYCREQGITSGVILGLIGSVQNARLNFLKELPGKYVTETYFGPLEIASGQGSVALKGEELLLHIHVQLSGPTAGYGGHLVEARVFSTAEVVIGELDFQLRRYADDYMGLNELA